MTVREAMEDNIVTFTFTKINGSHRIARGTRDLNLIPDAAHPKGTGTPPKKGILVFFDYEKKQWRSCRENTIFGPWKITEADLLHRIEKYEALEKQKKK